MAAKTAKRRSKPVIPRWLRPKLDPSQRLSLSICHHLSLTEMSSPHPTRHHLIDWCSGVLTWSVVAELLGKGTGEMAAMLHLCESVLSRYKSGGAIRLDSAEYAHARDGVMYMDELASIVDIDTAIQAADRSERMISTLI